jgi:hypothetical protein
MTNQVALFGEVGDARALRQPSSAWTSTTIEHSRWVRLLPLTFFFVYLNFSVFLFVMGPWDWPLERKGPLYLFLGAAHVALVLGYLSGASKPSAGYAGKWSVKRLIGLSVFINLALLGPTALYRIGPGGGDLLAGLFNPGEAYLQSAIVREQATPTVEYVRTLFGPLLFLVLPLAIFYWNELSRSLRILSVASIAGIAIMFIAMGTNKALADIVVLTPWMLLTARYAGRIRFGRKRVLITAIVTVLAIGAFLAFFTSTQNTRSGSASKYGYLSKPHVSVDYNNFMVRNLSPEAAVGVVGIVSYMSAGYFALYLSLDEPFVPTYGVGNSYFAARQVARLTGNNDITLRPYPMRIEERGWDAYGMFSSIYPWLASDVTFPGTIVIVFLIGRLFAVVWKDSLRGDNPFAIAMLAQLLIMLFYFPANNQALQFGEGFSAFWVILFLWWRERRRALVVAGSV